MNKNRYQGLHAMMPLNSHNIQIYTNNNLNDSIVYKQVIHKRFCFFTFIPSYNHNHFNRLNKFA